jgi:hypothetical protein
MRKVRLVGVVLCAVFAMSAAPASADDASVWAAYTARDGDWVAIGREWQDAFDAWEKNPRRVDPVVKVERKILRLGREIQAAIAAQPSSSAAGERGKQLLQRSGVSAARAHRLQLRGFITARRQARKSARYMRAAAREFQKSRRDEKRAIAVFKRLGIAPADYGASP